MKSGDFLDIDKKLNKGRYFKISYERLNGNYIISLNNKYVKENQLRKSVHLVS